MFHYSFGAAFQLAFLACTLNRANRKHTSKMNILSEGKCDSQRRHYNFHSILWAIFIFFLLIFSSTPPNRTVFFSVCTDHILHLSAKIKLCKFIFLFCRYIYYVSYFIMWFYFIFTFFFDSQLPMRHTHTYTRRLLLTSVSQRVLVLLKLRLRLGVDENEVWFSQREKT